MKKQIKKLSLNKKTISNLSTAEMSRQMGGILIGTVQETVPVPITPRMIHATENRVTISAFKRNQHWCKHLMCQ
jgi:hypothetical protein